VNSGGGTLSCCTPDARTGGRVGGGGILFPNAQVSIAMITDGTSSTLLVAESGDLLTTLDGTRKEWSSGRLGFAIGATNDNKPPSYNPGNDARAFNTLTIRYLINQKTGWPNGLGNCPATGVCDNYGNNVPLTSAHPGGVNALFADGSVRLLADALDLTTLARLATRDDGVAVSAP
jgi:prepilin-type processing-associated H-X9-DG protein